MGSVLGSDFKKKRQCPSSSALVSYHQRHLFNGQISKVASHLAACEFCAAELQLLSRLPSATEICETPEMPAHLRALATALLCKDGPGTIGALRRIDVHERPI